MKLRYGNLELEENEFKKMTNNFTSIDKIEAMNQFFHKENLIIDHLYNINQYYTDGLDLINDLYCNGHDYIAFMIISYEECSFSKLQLLTKKDIINKFEEFTELYGSDYAIYKAYSIKPKTEEEEIWLASFEEKYANLKVGSY